MLVFDFYRLVCYNCGMMGHGMSIHKEILDETVSAFWDFSDEAEFIVASRSSIRVIAADGFQAFTLREGEGVFIPPRTISSAAAASGSAVIHRISFPLSLIWQDTESPVYLKYSGPLLSLRSAVSLSPGAAENAERAYAVLSERDYCYELEARNLIVSVLIAILRETEGSAPQEGIFRNERMLGMMTYIKEHYSESISLHDIAAAGSVSERECLRTFRKLLGTSPVQYLISYRLSESVRLLESTELQIAEISYRTGFESPSHFSRSFRAFYGFSPSQWRRRLL